MSENQTTQDGPLDKTDINWLLRQIAIRPEGLEPLTTKQDEHGLRAWRRLANLLRRMEEMHD